MSARVRYRVVGYGRGLAIQEFAELKRTPLGVWLDMGAGEKRFVMDSGRKVFARTTKEAALQDFIARSRRHRSILRARLDLAEEQAMFAQNPEHVKTLMEEGHVYGLDW